MSDNNEVTVVCENCNEEYMLSAGLRERSANLPKMPDVTETGVACPHCQHWRHAYFMNDRLREMVAELQRYKEGFEGNRTEHRYNKWRAKVRGYKKAHERFNKRLRAQLGISGPVDTADLVEAVAEAELAEEELAEAEETPDVP